MEATGTRNELYDAWISGYETASGVGFFNERFDGLRASILAKFETWLVNRASPPASVPSPPEPAHVQVVDPMGHEWGCPAYNAKTFTVCTCGRIHEPDFGLAPEQSSPGQAG